MQVLENKKVCFHNLGCKVNSYELQAMQKMLLSEGCIILPQWSADADIFVINTCSVTNIADRKSRQMIHKARKLCPNAVIVATGCYIQQMGEKSDDDVDIIIGNNEKSRLVEILANYYEKGLFPLWVPEIMYDRRYDEMTIDAPMEHTRAYIKIQDGCNRFCTYCIIPYMRGPIRSRKVSDILSEAERVAKSGCKEVVLTGIHLSSYGLDKGFKGKEKLIDIIEKVCKVEGIQRVRIGSLEPGIVTEEFAQRLSKCEKICPHFHLSLQSGSDTVLKRMNRQYTAEEFYEGVCLLRKYFDNPAITTDVIVGFPGESGEEFAETVSFLEKVRFYELHVFKYSRRAGTIADKMGGQLTEKEKIPRSEALLKMDERISEEYRRLLIGSTQTVLFEEPEIIDGEEYMTGYTKTYVRVAVPKMSPDMAGQIKEVKIKELSNSQILKGEIYGA